MFNQFLNLAPAANSIPLIDFSSITVPQSRPTSSRRAQQTSNYFIDYKKKN